MGSSILGFFNPFEGLAILVLAFAGIYLGFLAWPLFLIVGLLLMIFNRVWFWKALRGAFRGMYKVVKR